MSKEQPVFERVPSKVVAPEAEERILEFWEKENIFRKSIDTRSPDRRFVFYEGPPTANGEPGVHHVITRVIKDLVCRYKTMKGYRVVRKAGWDTHGLPVEIEVEKELKIQSKEEIEKFGIAEFNRKCLESVFRYKKQWVDLTRRIGFWLDLDHPYVTMNNTYIESVWWAIKNMWDRGLVYQGHKVTPHCPRCGTSLSSHEVALGYQDDTEDPSVYIKFRIVEDQRGVLPTGKPVYLLAWTTTPWTLPGNTALAVSPDADYAILELENEYLIMADALRERVGLDSQEVVNIIKGFYLSYL